MVVADLEAHPEIAAGAFDVLVVEDRDSLRTMLRRTLEGKGYSVVDSRTAGDARRIPPPSRGARGRAGGAPPGDPGAQGGVPRSIRLSPDHRGGPGSPRGEPRPSARGDFGHDGAPPRGERHGKRT